MRHMYANRVTRGGSSKFSRGKGRESTMTASSGFKRSCGYFNIPRHKEAQCFTFLRDSGGGTTTFERRDKKYLMHHHDNTHRHDNADCHSQQLQHGNGGGSGYTDSNNNSGDGNIRHHGGGFHTGRANTVVTVIGISSPTAIAPSLAAPVTVPATPTTTPLAPVTVPSTPVTSRAAPKSYNVIESPPSGTGYLSLTDFISPGPLKFTMIRTACHRRISCTVTSSVSSSRG